MELPNLKVQCELCEKHYWNSFVIRKHMHDCKSYVGSVIPSTPWHNCIWNYIVISVESTSCIILLIEKHMDSHIDLVGAVTFVEMF